jgi:hypothetical protein
MGSFRVEVIDLRMSTKTGIVGISMNAKTEYTSSPGTRLSTVNEKKNFFSSLIVSFYANKCLVDYPTYKL